MSITRGSRARVMLYSHDTQGLGHVRRNLEIARALVRARPRTDVLLVTGAPEAAALPRPERTDLVVLPPVSKSGRGKYSATTLAVTLDEILHVRGSLVASAIGAFRPDLIIVDKEARGLRGELDPALAVARHTLGAHSGRRPRLVLGLRDVLDSPMAVRREWAAARTVPILRSFYDAVWVYGDRTVHDPTAGLDLPDDVLSRVVFAGYLARGRHRGESAPQKGPYVLGLVGGGQDGARLARAFVRARLPEGHSGILVTGPYMPSGVREELVAAQRPDLKVLGFVPDTSALITGASAIVTMGGYNSVCELLAAGHPGLIVPRVRPRREQAIRAEAMTARTHLGQLPLPELTPDALASRLASAVRTSPIPHDLDLDGLQRVAALAAELLDRPEPMDTPVSTTKELADVIA